MRKKLAPLNREYCELGVGDRVVGLPSPPPAPNLQANPVALPFFAPVPAHSLPFAVGDRPLATHSAAPRRNQLPIPANGSGKQYRRTCTRPRLLAPATHTECASHPLPSRNQDAARRPSASAQAPQPTDWSASATAVRHGRTAEKPETAPHSTAACAGSRGHRCAALSVVRV